MSQPVPTKEQVERIRRRHNHDGKSSYPGRPESRHGGLATRLLLDATHDRGDLLRRIDHLEAGLNILRNLHVEKHPGMLLGFESALVEWERIEKEAGR